MSSGLRRSWRCALTVHHVDLQEAKVCALATLDPVQAGPLLCPRNTWLSVALRGSKAGRPQRAVLGITGVPGLPFGNPRRSCPSWHLLRILAGWPQPPVLLSQPHFSQDSPLGPLPPRKDVLE